MSEVLFDIAWLFTVRIEDGVDSCNVACGRRRLGGWVLAWTVRHPLGPGMQPVRATCVYLSPYLRKPGVIYQRLLLAEAFSANSTRF